MNTIYLDERIDRVIHIQGEDYLYFSGTSYLGIGQSEDYKKILVENIFRYGPNHGQSRNNNVRLRVFGEFEEEFAKGAKAESSLVFSSGYLAGIAAWQVLFPNSDLCWVAPDTHPAIVPSTLKPNTQLDFIQWKNTCLEVAESISPQKILILGNALNPLSAEIHSYHWVEEIAKKHEVTLLIDDSHAFGVLGEGLYGTYHRHASPNYDLLVSGSLGKGLGMPAGIILGQSKHIEKIRNQALYGGASPGSPANLQAFLDSIDIYLQKKEWLNSLCQSFYHKTKDIKQLKGGIDLPVFIYSEDSWVEKLEKEKIITSSFPYPTSQDPRVNRIIISGFHREEDLLFLTEKLNELSTSS
ncbi:aminotransferase class I/II-fold pyridoxal phosphate-dependent enzyme [Algoriphagus sp. CAU 1675]|uniref:aminotransferase class I/II-fold pyridoxal phosphate-dependent enzyme n=1 Tax=Algoriphagus sp. CAU 1675 TaxID=3032597 RepID=UPI0023DC712B|nr:aminotransferase class I/II-fold pyridoxal phosphate-dependent enzyme [Algoriphagus sp. CAU 1675]MDF2156380.1 aminotransferase class I/II-fold pyridoxal phosphate-dependent enzyme [Algoriphagus sp. CAU 1675]